MTAADQPGGTPAKADRGMRLPFRVLWFLGYHLVLWGSLISAANAPSRRASLLYVVLGFVLGVGLVLQASAKLPAFFHGLALLVILPGLLYVAPETLSSAFQQAVTSPREVTVLSSTAHDDVSIGGSMPGVRTYDYRDVTVRLPDGSTEKGLLRPDRTVANGSQIRLDVDPLGLIRPQNNNVAIPVALVLVTLLILLLAELELVSALVRPEGGSFIAASGRSAKPDAPGKDGPLRDKQ